MELEEIVDKKSMNDVTQIWHINEVLEQYPMPKENKVLDFKH